MKNAVEVKTQELEIIDPNQFGLKEDKAVSINDAFLPKVVERNLTVAVYENIIGKEINEETAKEARELRLKIAKIRTGIKAAHKAEKEMSLAYGKYCDARKNKEVLPCEQMEEKLLEIEKFQENIEAERVEKLNTERTTELEKYNVENIELLNVGSMPEGVWKTFLDGTIFGYEKKIKEEKEAKLEEEKKAKKEAEEKKEAEAKAKKIEEEKRAKEIEAAKVKAKKDAEAKAEADKKAAAEKVKEEKAEADRKHKAEIERLKKEKEQKEIDRIAAEKKAKEEKAEALKKAEADKQAAIKAEKEKAEQIAKEKLEKIEADKKAELEANLNKGDAAKVVDLKHDLTDLKSKYVFKSAKNKKMYSDVCDLLDKVYNHIK